MSLSSLSLVTVTTLTIAVTGISPVDPESRKLYEILTGRSYSTDHRMRDWLARSLAVEDASVEQQAPTFTPLVESFTSDEEDEFTVGSGTQWSFFFNTLCGSTGPSQAIAAGVDLQQGLCGGGAHHGGDAGVGEHQHRPLPAPQGAHRPRGQEP